MGEPVGSDTIGIKSPFAIVVAAVSSEILVSVIVVHPILLLIMRQALRCRH